jgi:uncharacterized phage protein (TIGR01671 family)
MREIKFRAWDNLRRKFLNRVEVLNLTIGHFYVSGYTFSQSTGLKDKNGNDIYEGDILQWGENNQNKGLVKFGELPLDKNGDCVCSFPAFYIDGSISYWRGYEAESFGNYQEVIGNIYETPELLK